MLTNLVHRRAALLRSRFAILALGTAAACSDTSAPSIPVIARILNGPSAATSLAGIQSPSTDIASAGSDVAAAPAPATGYWLLSPDQASLKIVRIALEGGSMGRGITVDCAVTYDRFKVGLASIGDCAFPAPAGSYTGVNLTFSSTYSVLISDAVNGFYSNSSGIVTSAPTGGAQGLVVTLPSSDGEFSMSIPFMTPLVVSATAPPELSVVINGIQFFHVNVSFGLVSLGWPGTTFADPFRPDIAAAPRALSKTAFYAAQSLGSTGSYCAAACGATAPTGVTSLSVYYASTGGPIVIGMALNGTPSTCGPFGVNLVSDSRGYLGLDSGGNLGWAIPLASTWTTYSSELRMAEVSTLAATTTLYCQKRSTDPAPVGGSYSGGAPAIATSGNSLGAYVLVAK